ncbi:ATP-binding protein [Candidatus Saganbacteria bacterium]|nr:ATP-binding protein [Candidatus Saganbacteria bacterium]
MAVSENLGHLAESLVFWKLKQQMALNPNLELFFWKDTHHREVDFLLKESLSVNKLIQVCWNINQEKTRDREIRALLLAMDKFNLSEALIINDDQKSQEVIKGKTIKTVPLWQWLLFLSS